MDIIDEIIQREGPPSNDPLDNGGRTAWGISERGNPEAWKNGPPTYAEARVIYESKYVKGPGFDKIDDLPLRNQLIDFGVTSGPALAILKLQSILEVDPDGKLGPKTLAALLLWDGDRLNNALVAARVSMIGRIVTKNPSQLKFLRGWLIRALSFLQ